jgi:hypothetical protein
MMEDGTMAVEEYLEPEVAVAVTITATMGSPRARRVVRQGAVYGLAGLLKAYDVAGVFARGVGRGIAQSTQVAEDAEDTAAPVDPSDDGEAVLAPRAAHRRSAHSGSSAAAMTAQETESTSTASEQAQSGKSNAEKDAKDSGKPGGGAGRREEIRGSGVYPASGPWPEGDAPFEGEAAWGQGKRGEKGYEDHGTSETKAIPVEGEQTSEAGAGSGTQQS